jgi:hypothetical protein
MCTLCHFYKLLFQIFSLSANFLKGVELFNNACNELLYLIVV